MSQNEHTLPNGSFHKSQLIILSCLQQEMSHTYQFTKQNRKKATVCFNRVFYKNSHVLCNVTIKEKVTQLLAAIAGPLEVIRLRVTMYKNM